jgi:hypothetical protein
VRDRVVKCVAIENGPPQQRVQVGLALEGVIGLLQQLAP